jgi:hypothetical protein
MSSGDGDSRVALSSEVRRGFKTKAPRSDELVDPRNDGSDHGEPGGVIPDVL